MIPIGSTESAPAFDRDKRRGSLVYLCASVCICVNLWFHFLSRPGNTLAAARLLLASASKVEPQMYTDARRCDGAVEARRVVVRKIKRDGVLAVK